MLASASVIITMSTRASDTITDSICRQAISCSGAVAGLLVLAAGHSVLVLIVLIFDLLNLILVIIMQII